MDWKTYQQNAAKTSGFRDDPHINGRVIVAALGLAGEAGELANKLKKEIGHQHPTPLSVYEDELGDVLWYAAELCTATGKEFGNMKQHESQLTYPTPEQNRLSGVTLLLRLCGDTADLFIHLALDDSLYQLRHSIFDWHLGSVLTALYDTVAAFGLTIEQVADANIAKLAKRYPQGFSPEASLNREVQE